MSKSEQKRLERKQRKKREKRQRNFRREQGQEKLATQQQSELIWPTCEVVQIDKIEENLVHSITAAWLRAALAKELNGERSKDLDLANKHGFQHSRLGWINWSIILGKLLYRELIHGLGPSTLRRLDVEVHATGQIPSHVQLNVRSLEYVKSFVVCSPKRPTIKIGTEDFVVAYDFLDDDHFVRRLEERTVVAPGDYIGKGQVFACLYKWQLFEPFNLPSGQLATRLWNWCDPQTPLNLLWNEFLGEEVSISDYNGLQFYESDRGRAYYLVGYCPIDERTLPTGYAVLKTLLLPGMDNTPEAAALQRGMTKDERITFRKQAERQSMKELSLVKDFSVIRSYHSRVPQVRLISEPVFSEYFI